MLVRWTEKEKVWEGEVRTQQGSHVVLLEAKDRHVFPVPYSCLHPAGKSSSFQGKAGSFQGEVNVILPSFQVFDFELTPEDMEAIDGINRNIRYYEYLM